MYLGKRLLSLQHENTHCLFVLAQHPESHYDILEGVGLVWRDITTYLALNLTIFTSSQEPPSDTWQGAGHPRLSHDDAPASNGRPVS